MIDPSMVLFAIEAGVRLGRKINEVLVDETAQRPLLMPLGDLFGTVAEAEAMRFYSVEQPDLIKPGGSCFAIRDDRAKLIQVYRAMRGIETQVMAPASDLNAKRKEIMGQLGALDQSMSLHDLSNVLACAVTIIALDLVISTLTQTRLTWTAGERSERNHQALNLRRSLSEIAAKLRFHRFRPLEELGLTSAIPKQQSENEGPYP